MEKKYLKTQYACFLTSFAGAAAANLSPLLFLTFHKLYGISYSLLGLLVVINFGTQLLFDLAFSFFSHRFDLKMSVKATPAVMTLGFVLYAVLPFFFPDNVYPCLVVGTVIFSAGGGLSEVLTSPTVSALPSKDPEKLLSLLHSCYAWGVVFFVTVTTLYLHFAGEENWQYLSFFFSALTILASALFVGAEIPELSSAEKASEAAGLFRNKNLILCVLCIFLGGASECTMSQWCSGYLEQALGVPKLLGDLLGMALFGVMLGLGRTLYSKYGKNTLNILLAGSVGASVCYITAVVSRVPALGLAACALTGFCVSMLWPGSLIVAEKRIPEGGVTMYALMAAGGDLGASVCPQLVGIITDAVIAGSRSAETAEKLGLGVDQLGMKCGMAFAALFPICAIAVFLRLKNMPEKNPEA